MKNLVAFVSILVCVGFVTAHRHVGNATQCFACRGSSLDVCMDMLDCSDDTFPNFGDGKHCYTAAGWYRNMANTWASFVIRGCTNCSVLAATKESLGNLTGLSMGSIQWNFDLMYLNVTCCTSDKCNNMTATLLPEPTDAPPSMNNDTTQPPDNVDPTKDSGDYANRLSPLAFVLIAIVLLFK